MNRAILTGRLTKDPEVRYTSTQKAVATMRIAVQNGKDTIFLNVKAWNATAENCGKYLAKGSVIGVDGSIHIDEYEKDGQKRQAFEIWADRVEFIETGKREKSEEPEGFAQIEEALPF